MGKYKCTYLRGCSLILLVVFMCVCFSGCWSYQEVDATAHVLVLGLDIGAENKLTWTAQIAIPRNIYGTGSGGNSGSRENDSSKSNINISVESPTFSTAISIINLLIEYQISLKHLKAIVFSEEIAREGLMTYINVLARHPEFRRTVVIAVSRQVSAKEFVENSANLLVGNPTKPSELLVDYAPYSGLIPAKSAFHYFYNAIKSDSGDPITFLVGLKRETEQGEGKKTEPNQWVPEGDYYPGEIPRSGGNPIEALGAAVFQDDRLVGEIKGTELMGLMLIRGSLRETYLSVEDPFFPGKMLAFKVIANDKPEVHIDLNGEVPQIHLTTHLEAVVLGSQTSGFTYEEPENRIIMEQAVSQELVRRMENITQRAQTEFNADILNFGDLVKHQFLTQESWTQYRWLKDKFAITNIQYTVDTQIRLYGFLNQSKPLSREME